MFTTPQKRGGAANLFRGSPNKKIPLKGLFVDGIWHCNCDPRLPASHFQVKKEGRNKGKWFYTCQQSKDISCGFFLWDDDAVGREMQAVIANSRTEAEGLRTPADTASGKNAVESPVVRANDWIRNLGKAKEGNDDFGEFPLSAEEVEEVQQVAGQGKGLPGSYPETPRKAVKTAHFSTPGSKRKRDENTLPTPVTAKSKEDDVFSTPSTTRPKEAMWDGNEHFGLRSPSITPTPSRFRDAIEGMDARRESTNQGYEITEEVMALLKDQNINDETTLNLKQLLNKHALKMLGIARGRDIIRVALKAKDVKIAELQQKITALEAEREMDKSIIRHVKSDIAQNISTRRGRGRGRS